MPQQTPTRLNQSSEWKGNLNSSQKTSIQTSQADTRETSILKATLKGHFAAYAQLLETSLVSTERSISNLKSHQVHYSLGLSENRVLGHRLSLKFSCCARLGLQSSRGLWEYETLFKLAIFPRTSEPTIDDQASLSYGAMLLGLGNAEIEYTKQKLEMLAGWKKGLERTLDELEGIDSENKEHEGNGGTPSSAKAK